MQRHMPLCTAALDGPVRQGRPTVPWCQGSGALLPGHVPAPGQLARRIALGCCCGFVHAWDWRLVCCVLCVSAVSLSRSFYSFVSYCTYTRRAYGQWFSMLDWPALNANAKEGCACKLCAGRVFVWQLSHKHTQRSSAGCDRLQAHDCAVGERCLPVQGLEGALHHSTGAAALQAMGGGLSNQTSRACYGICDC